MPTAPASTLHAGLRENHHKLTRPRQIILDIITQSERHLTPAEIYRRAKTRHAQIGLTTVYRTLDLLAELGYVQRVHFSRGCHSYAPIARPRGHHLICSDCGRVEEFPCGEIDPLIEKLQAQTGYTIDLHVLELMGHCPDCRAKRRARKR